jgi:hypothetical protein
MACYVEFLRQYFGMIGNVGWVTWDFYCAFDEVWWILNGYVLLACCVEYLRYYLGMIGDCRVGCWISLAPMKLLRDTFHSFRHLLVCFVLLWRLKSSLPLCDFPLIVCSAVELAASQSSLCEHLLFPFVLMFRGRLHVNSSYRDHKNFS